MVKTIFVKLIVHKLKTFFGTISSFFEDLLPMGTPREMQTEDGPFMLSRSFMFEGHQAYFRLMLPLVRKFMVGHRGQSLKEEITGMLLLHLLDCRSSGEFEGEGEEQALEEEQYRREEDKKFNEGLFVSCKDLLGWVTGQTG